MGANCKEILYADDAILVSLNKRTVQKYLYGTEADCAKYVMRLNQDMCEAVTIKAGETIQYQDGT